MIPAKWPNSSPAICSGQGNSHGFAEVVFAILDRRGDSPRCFAETFANPSRANNVL